MNNLQRMTERNRLQLMIEDSLKFEDYTICYHPPINENDKTRFSVWKHENYNIDCDCGRLKLTLSNGQDEFIIEQAGNVIDYDVFRIKLYLENWLKE
jgi:hypothetical protein